MALPAAPTGSQPSNSALQRLQRDVREYERSFPLKMQRGQGGREYGVTAQPREGNLLVWDTTVRDTHTHTHTHIRPMKAHTLYLKQGQRTRSTLNAEHAHPTYTTGTDTPGAIDLPVCVCVCVCGVCVRAQMVAATGSLAGEPIEMTIEFRDDYPSQPPNVVLHTRIRDHPNVFGDWICLDMIKVGLDTHTHIYTYTQRERDTHT